MGSEQAEGSKQRRVKFAVMLFWHWILVSSLPVAL
jgi:hypothetical protein